MSWFSKTLCAALSLCLLSGCGFEPLYAKKPKSDRSKVFAGVRVDPIKGGHAEERLRHGLEDNLNPNGGIPVNPQFRLSVTFNSSVVPIGVARDGTVSRYNVYSNSHYVLFRIADDQKVTAGDVSYVNSYNNLTNEYFSTYISSEDALKRNIDQLCQMYRERLTAYLDAGAPEQDIKPAMADPAGKSVYTPTLFNQLPNTPVMNKTH